MTPYFANQVVAIIKNLGIFVWVGKMKTNFNIHKVRLQEKK
jgi:hypothetical protein